MSTIGNSRAAMCFARSSPVMINVISTMLLRFAAAMLCSISLMSSTPAKAMLIEFKAFTTEGSYYNDPGLDLYVEIIDAGSQVRFEFHNDSTIASSIEGIYFEDGVLDGIAGFEFGSGTLFGEGAKPSNPPGGNTLDRPFATAYSADSEPPTSHNGIEPGQQLTIIFDLDSGAMYSNLLSQLADSTLRIGLHVISLPDGSSFSAIPEPVTMLPLSLGALVLIRRRWRYRDKKGIRQKAEKRIATKRHTCCDLHNTAKEAQKTRS